MRVHLRTAIVVLLTVGLVALFLRNANLREVWTAMLESRWDLLLLALVTTALTYVLRALRWQYLLAPIGTTRFSTAFRATVIGFAASALLPARAGEVLRPYLLARWEGFSATAALATILVERLLDLATAVFLLSAFLLLFQPGVGGLDPQLFAAVRLGGFVAAGLAVGSLSAVFLLAGHPETLGRWALRAERLLPPRGARALARTVERFIGGFAVMRHPRRLIIALGLSCPLWVLIATGIWLASAAFRIEFPYTGSFLMMAVLVVGVSVPTPGAVGGFHEAYRLGVTTFYGAPNDRAVAAAIVLHALSVLPVVLVGAVFMAQAGLDLRGVRQLARAGERAQDEQERIEAPPPAPAPPGTEPTDVPALSAFGEGEDGGAG